MGRILIAEDDPDARHWVQDLLESEGYEVAAVEGGREAVRRLGKERYDAVVTDMRLGDYHGALMVRVVRQNWPETPVVLVTAYRDDPMVSSALAAGAAALLCKPFAPEEILATLRGILGRDVPKRDRHVSERAR